MKILVSCYVLDLSGTPTYTLTLYNELVRRGHDVTVYSPESGKLAKHMNVVTSLDGMATPDVIIVHMNTCAVSMRQAFPDAPMIFSAHGVLPVTEQPPACEVQWYTAINEDVRDNLIAQGVDPNRIDIVRDFVDTERFRPIEPIGDKPGRVLFISNFKKWKTYFAIEKACQKVGAGLKAVGSPYGRSYAVEYEINQADLVISVARGILEAMACGRPVISFDQMRGDGYLTPEVYLESRTRNFAGAKCQHAFDASGLADEIRKYNLADGVVNRGIALDQHGHIAGVDLLLEIAGKVMR